MAIIQKCTQEELDLKIKMLDLEREEEMNTAEKSGEDVFLIDESIRKKTGPVGRIRIRTDSPDC